jgi:nucleoside-diphosphate-sugar epimerase
MMDPMRTILLTGAGGFIGRHVLRDAASRGSRDRWILTDLRAPQAWWGLPGRTEFVAGDLADRGFCRDLSAKGDITHVIHLAGWLGKGGSDEDRDILLRANLLSTVNLLDALREREAPHFLLPSTGLVYGDQQGPFHEAMPVLPRDDYAWSKHLAEQTLLTYARNGLARACIVRPAVIYGPGQRGEMFIPSLVRSLREGKRFAMTAGEQKRDLLCVEDLARALLLLCESNLEGKFNAGTGRGVLLKEIARIGAGLLGRPELLGLGDIPYRSQEVWDYALDPSRLQEATGWEPLVALEEGIRKTIEWENQAP